MPVVKLMRAAKEWLGFNKDIQTSPNARASFSLKYNDLLIGTLSVQSGIWKFEYSSEFRKNNDLRPIVEFPDVNKVYERQDLWQFFASRIPSTEQEEVMEILRRENISETDSVGLLKRFGKQTISNPFYLEAA